MLDLKNNKLLVFLAFLVVLIGIGLLVGRQTTVSYKMQQAMANHAHENALAMASRLLAQEPNNQEAIATIKTAGQILAYLQLAQANLPNVEAVDDQTSKQLVFYKRSTPSATTEAADPNRVLLQAEQVYADFNQASAYVAQAKALDADFKTTLSLEKKLDEVSSYLLSTVATNTLHEGESIYSKVFKDYTKKSAVISSASGSDYLDQLLTIQSAFSPMEISATTIEQEINPLLDKLDDTAKLVLQHQTGDLADPLLRYIDLLRKSVATLLSPKGNYKDFIKTTDGALNDYQRAHKKLKRALPNTRNATNFSALVEAIADYKLFEHAATAGLIDKNKHLLDL